MSKVGRREIVAALEEAVDEIARIGLRKAGWAESWRVIPIEDAGSRAQDDMLVRRTWTRPVSYRAGEPHTVTIYAEVREPLSAGPPFRAYFRAEINESLACPWSTSSDSVVSFLWRGDA